MAEFTSCGNTQNKINTEWCKENEGEKQGQKYSNLSCLVIFFLPVFLDIIIIIFPHCAMGQTD